ncbi:MAG TPA: hypothetical protein VEB62_11445, partial [Brevundimonas sp.]|nr:hypothetical protein [Brevundimonas sp.]
MKRTVLTAAAVLLAGTASVPAPARAAPQTPPASTRPATDLTRDLNSGPPTIAEYLARPVTPEPAPATTPAPAPTPAPATPRPAPVRATTAPTPAPAPVRPTTAPVTT